MSIQRTRRAAKSLLIWISVVTAQVSFAQSPSSEPLRMARFLPAEPATLDGTPYPSLLVEEYGDLDWPALPPSPRQLSGSWGASGSPDDDAKNRDAATLEAEAIPPASSERRSPPPGRSSRRMARPFQETAPQESAPQESAPQESAPRESAPREAEEVSGVASPWWWGDVRQPLRPGVPAVRVDLQNLLLDALAHSYFVKAISDTPLITRTLVTDAAAEFDTKAFLDTKFVRRSDPTGSVLETGGPPRLRSEDWQNEFGISKKTRRGGEFRAAQRFGTYDSNSRFLSPTNQGNARLSLSYTLPLLNGAGRSYNEGLIVLAELETDASHDQTQEKLEQHLLDLTRVYWALYLERATLLQRRRYLKQAELIAQRLRERRDVDSARIQVLQAEAAVAARRSELLQSEMAIANAQQRICALVNSPRFSASDKFEIIPQEQPAHLYLRHDVKDALAVALTNRPEVDEAMQQVYMASKRLDLATNELRPVLDLVLETYVAGLQGDLNVGRAWTDQFWMGEPGYTLGLRFEMPLCNRAARSLHERRMLELRQASNSLQATMETLKAEVTVAVNEVETSYRQIGAKRAAMNAAQAEVDYLFARWQLLPVDGRNPSALLDDLLRAQDRLALEEQGAARADYGYTMSLANVKRQMGILFRAEDTRGVLPADPPTSALNASPPRRAAAPPPGNSEAKDPGLKASGPAPPPMQGFSVPKARIPEASEVLEARSPRRAGEWVAPDIRR